jgi:hypothetical protein
MFSVVDRVAATERDTGVEVLISRKTPGAANRLAERELLQ